jgi:methyl-accepting chemotaxis protein
VTDQTKKETKDRISHIVGILQNIAMGDFSQNIDIPENEDELTELLVALNLMIDDLKEADQEIRKHHQELEQKVEKRTRKLEEKIAETEMMNKLMVGRELKMIELKEEIKRLKKDK